MVVVFPAPFGPRNPKHSPLCTSKSTPFTASKPLKLFLRSRAISVVVRDWVWINSSASVLELRTLRFYRQPPAFPTPRGRERGGLCSPARSTTSKPPTDAGAAHILPHHDEWSRRPPRRAALSRATPLQPTPRQGPRPRAAAARTRATDAAGSWQSSPERAPCPRHPAPCRGSSARGRRGRSHPARRPPA